MSLLTSRSLEGRVLSVIDGQLDPLHVREILDEELREITSSWDWSFGKVRGTISTVAPKNSGTVSVSSGGTSVVGSGTNFDPEDVGSFIRIGDTSSPRYEVTAVASSTNLTISPAYIDSTVTAATYTLFKSYYKLVPKATHIIAAAIRWPLYEIRAGELEVLDAQRQGMGEPIYYSYLGMDSSEQQTIELYPVPDARYVVRYIAFSMDEIGTSASKAIVILNGILLKRSIEQACLAVAAKKPSPEDQKWLAIADRYGRQWRESMILLQQWDMSMRGDVTGPIVRAVSDEFAREHDIDLAFILGYSNVA